MDSPWVRLILAISLDGRLAFRKGEKAYLGGKGDRQVLEEALAWSDATLVGGETLRLHQNTCIIKDSKLIKKRQLNGQSDQPITIVVSRKKNFSKDWYFFKQPITRWLLTKTNKSEPHFREGKDGFEREYYLESKWSKTLGCLNKSGISKILLLGGSELIKSFIKEDMIDEMQLTLTPRILGGESLWLTINHEELNFELKKTSSWVLKETKELGGNEVMIRYLRNRVKG